MPRVPSKERVSKAETSSEIAPQVPMWKGKTVDEAKKALIEKIREGMPSVQSMQTQGFGVLRRHKEWEQKSRPYILELEAIEGRPVSVERYRPGR